MSTELKEKIKHDMIACMRSQDRARLGVIRLLQAAIKQKEVDERISLSDTQVLAIIEKMIKQRKESIRQYEQGNRADLAAKEAQEIEILDVYMPTPLAADELDSVIKAAVQQVNATAIKDMGKVMQILKDQLQGRADMREVSAKVKDYIEQQ